MVCALSALHTSPARKTARNAKSIEGVRDLAQLYGRADRRHSNSSVVAESRNTSSSLLDLGPRQFVGDTRTVGIDGTGYSNPGICRFGSKLYWGFFWKYASGLSMRRYNAANPVGRYASRVLWKGGVPIAAFISWPEASKAVRRGCLLHCGALLSRYGWIWAGRASAQDPHALFQLQHKT
jgi:hypothetical protein